MPPSLKAYILTLFPEFFGGLNGYSLFQRAFERGLFELETVDFRAFSQNKHKKVDDLPYGGGSGMLLTPQPLAAALESLPLERSLVMVMSARGLLWQQERVLEVSRLLGLVAGVPSFEGWPEPWQGRIEGKAANIDQLVLVCGHYEGIDERIAEEYADVEISIGDYILTGGETAAMVVLESLARYLPGFVGNRDSLSEESHADGLLEYPQYTRPENFHGRKVPEVLLSGHHSRIEQWRLERKKEVTQRVRPDLWRKWLEGGRSKG
jgi:tRNA (guanine37-N1)-methyltransferase